MMWRQKSLFITAIIIIVIILLLIWGRHTPITTKEPFDPLLIYRTEQSLTKLKLDIDPSVPAKCIASKTTGFDWLAITNPGSPDSDLFASDVFTYSRLAKDTKAVVVVLGCDRYFYIQKSDQTMKANTLQEVIQDRLPIYAGSDTHKVLLNAIVTAIGLNPRDVIWANSQTASAVFTRFDYLDASAHSRRPKASFISFDTGFDIHKLKSQISFSVVENVDMSTYYDTGDDKFPIKPTLKFKTIIWTRHHSIKQDAWIRELIDSVGDTDDTSYFTKHFEFLAVTLDELKKVNRLVIARDRLPILEQFAAGAVGSVDIEASSNVVGYYDSKNKTLVLEKPYIDGIPIEIASNIILSKQTREEENGVYLYKSPWLVKVEEPAITLAQKPKQYICYGDETIKNKGLCESPFDAMGELKAKQGATKTVWDRPCVSNSECPFYQTNKNYSNYRGGCNDGYCEMPLGITRLGFTKYDRETARPICHGCPDDNPYCCNEQENPDYAFELDER